MDGAFSPDGFAFGPNLSGTPHPGWNLNLSFPSLWATPGQPARTISAAAIMLLALVGNGLLLHRLHCGGCCCGGRFGRRRKMDFLLAHLAIADLYGCGLTLLSQLPPAADDAGEESGDAEWPVGDATCRLLRLLQSSGMLAPSHMLVLIALERHHMVTGPPHPLPSFMPARGALAALGWLLALLLALPEAFVYKLLPRWHGQTYAVYRAITGFVAPACLLGGTCGRILSTLSSSRAKEEEPSRGAAPAPRSLPRARARALQLTLALATLFVLCGFPRFILELGLAFASSEHADDGARATLGSIIAATNSALNPYVCLLFHSHGPWARRLQRSLCRCPDGQPRRRAHHQHRPSPQMAAERTGHWLCPCQSKTPTVSTVTQQEEVETQVSTACESGF
ncbi:probable G-protein coupled receptor 150 [Rhineura floridana]|uniref:probable G-protein coupled receptor 150 n=1 Tax=Rhineura floridana TaxID=261503 RepID=UPI002AC83915|nr:probable G-protein coupled receptor 150 [Rhineura floridana]